MFRTSRRLIITLAIAAMSLGNRSSTANLAFTAHYDGRGAEGLDDIWRGTLDQPDAGVIEIRVETVTDGPAHGFVFVSHDILARSFGATVTGSVEGQTMHLTGPIDVGQGSGATIDLTMHLGHGTIRKCEGSSRARSSRSMVSCKGLAAQPRMKAAGSISADGS